MSSLYLELTQITDEVKPIYIHKKYTKLKQFETQIINFHPAVTSLFISFMSLCFPVHFVKHLGSFGCWLSLTVPSGETLLQ
jgi:hypothetical protein